MAEFINRGELVKTVAQSVDEPQIKVDKVIKAMEDAIVKQLAKGGEIRLAGFGTFRVSQRSARTSRNPRTGEPVEVAARSAPSFKAGKALKDAAAASTAPPPVKKAPGKVEPAAKASKAPAKAKAPSKKK